MPRRASRLALRVKKTLASGSPAELRSVRDEILVELSRCRAGTVESSASGLVVQAALSELLLQVETALADES